MPDRGLTGSGVPTLPLVEAAGLAVSYGGPPALEDVTFAVPGGQTVGLLGPNGGGKTTLLRALLGELRPLRGGVALRGRAGIVPQSDRSRLDFPVTALDVAMMGAFSRLRWWQRPARQERRRARAALARVGLDGPGREPFGELSGGQRQRVLIARALVQDARVLLLDEPFSGVDVTSGELIMALLRELAAEGRALLIATHDINQARAFDRVLCLNTRQIAFGPPAEVLTRATLEATYGAEIVFIEAGDAGATSAVAVQHHHHGAAGG